MGSVTWVVVMASYWPINNITSATGLIGAVRGMLAEES